MVGACWRPSWRSWLGYRARTALACCVAAAALSAGATLGSTGLVPACPAPAELRVLTSAEDLAAIQAAIPGFEQYEPAHLHTACYAVDVTAYAGPADSAVETGIAAGWDTTALRTIGPRPDIWIPASSAEVAQVSDGARAGVRLTPLGSVGSSPLVVAVPADRAGGSLARLTQGATWGSLYHVLTGGHIGLA